jgi:5-methylcytosine-specific restriction enzyme A
VTEARSSAALVYRRWYKSAQWLAIRKQQLALEPLCRMCAAVGRVTPANTADHVEPHRGDRESFFAGPFQSLCHSHHSSDKQAIERGGKPKVEIGRDGWPIEPGGRGRVKVSADLSSGPLRNSPVRNGYFSR